MVQFYASVDDDRQNTRREIKRLQNEVDEMRARLVRIRPQEFQKLVDDKTPPREASSASASTQQGVAGNGTSVPKVDLNGVEGAQTAGQGHLAIADGRLHSPRGSDGSLDPDDIEDAALIAEVDALLDESVTSRSVLGRSIVPSRRVQSSYASSLASFDSFADGESSVGYPESVLGLADVPYSPAEARIPVLTEEEVEEGDEEFSARRAPRSSPSVPMPPGPEEAVLSV